MRTRLLLLAVLVGLLTLITVAPAVAEGGIPPTVGGSIGTTPGPGSGTPAPGGSTPGGSIPVPCAGCHWVFDGINFGPTQVDFNLGSSGRTDGAHISGNCDPRPLPYNDHWFATSVTFWYAVHDDGTWAGGFDWVCHYPPRPTDTPIRCSESVHGSAARVLPAPVLPLGSISQTSAWASDRTNATKCAKSKLNISLGVPVKPVGLYSVPLSSTEYPCIRRDYPQTKRASKIVRCGAAVTAGLTVKGEAYCAGGKFHYIIGAGAGGHGPYDYQDCTGGSGALIQCNTSDDVVKFNTTDARNPNNPAQSFHDGSREAFLFPPLAPTGVTNVHNISSTLVMHGSPYREGIPVSDDTRQPFGGLYKFDIAHAGDITNWPVWFQASTNPGQPFNVRRASVFDGSLRTKVMVITSVNMETGAVTTTTRTETVPADGIECQSPVGYLTIFRARNSSN